MNTLQKPEPNHLRGSFRFPKICLYVIGTLALVNSSLIDLCAADGPAETTSSGVSLGTAHDRIGSWVEIDSFESPIDFESRSGGFLYEKKTLYALIQPKLPYNELRIRFRYQELKRYGKVVEAQRVVTAQLIKTDFIFSDFELLSADRPCLLELYLLIFSKEATIRYFRDPVRRIRILQSFFQRANPEAHPQLSRAKLDYEAYSHQTVEIGFGEKLSTLGLNIAAMPRIDHHTQLPEPLVSMHHTLLADLITSRQQRTIGFHGCPSLVKKAAE